MDQEQITTDAKPYRLLRNYLLRRGFVVHQKIKKKDEPFVVDADFYGPTFGDAVDALEKLAGSRPLLSRRCVRYQMAPISKVR